MPSWSNWKELNKNVPHSRNNIDHFAPLYESEDEEGTQHRTKPNNPSISLMEIRRKVKRREAKTGEMKKMETTRKRR